MIKRGTSNPRGMIDVMIILATDLLKLDIISSLHWYKIIIVFLFRYNYYVAEVCSDVIYCGEHPIYL